MSKELVVGYGTLLSSASASVTIGDKAPVQAKLVPVRVGGFRRSFNLRPEHYEPSYLLSGDPLEVGAMNVTEDDGAWLNAVAFEVDHESLALLDERERYYIRKRASIEEFSTGKSLGEGWVYSCPLDAKWIVQDPRRLRPRWLDVALGLGGSLQVSASFGRAFEETTYLADGQALLMTEYDRLRSMLTNTFLGYQSEHQTSH